MLFDIQPSDKKALTVSEITRLIKQSLESGFPRVWIQGEISNCRRHSSGHWYFTLKDDAAQISAVMWRSRAESLLFTPQDGDKVQVRGGISVYPPRGVYQVDVVQLLPLGIGELQIAFEELKRRLAAEGLFDAAHKKPIPRFPERIGVVTSPTGAALQDIRSVLTRRFPALEIILVPVRVQGAGAGDEIADAIRLLNSYGGIDVMIVGRGGGSLEDLWAFNEEIVARAIYDSVIPVISAVGHEIDFCIADFVADLRAPTPSAAAEMVVQDRRDLVDILNNIRYTIRQRAQERIEESRDRVKHLLLSYSLNRPKDLVLQYSQRVDELDKSLLLAVTHRFERFRNSHASLFQQLEALSPKNVLRRGYAIVRKADRVVTRKDQLADGDETSVQFQDGSVPARIGKTGA